MMMIALRMLLRLAGPRRDVFSGGGVGGFVDSWPKTLLCLSFGSPQARGLLWIPWTPVLAEQAGQRLAVARGNAVAVAMASVVYQPHAVALDRDDRGVVGRE